MCLFKQADEMSTSLLVFLVAEPEELPTLKRDKPLHVMLQEKLREKREKEREAAMKGPYAMAAVAVQG